jgi:hypothetical protein
MDKKRKEQKAAGVPQAIVDTLVSSAPLY